MMEQKAAECNVTTDGSSLPVNVLIQKKKNTKNRSNSLTYFPVDLKKSQVHYFLFSLSYHVPLLEIKTIAAGPVLRYFYLTVYTEVYQAPKSIQAEKKYCANLCTNQ